MSDEFIMLKDVRVSFPHLYTPPTIGGEVGKCGGTLLLDPLENGDAIAEIERHIAAITSERNKGKELPADKLCLRDGKDKGRDEYEGYMVLSANSKDTPLVLDTDGRTKVQDERSCKIYAGCYVNAKVRLWFQNNKYGKRINSALVAIQFAKDGEPLDGTYVSEDTAAVGFDAIAANDDWLGSDVA